MDYRREIDGLRAVAVVPVILFHAGFSTLSGGYVGVDVFFVISGYLITSILLKERAQGSFSILKFYERRARRILPALFTVIIACIPFAWTWMVPEQFQSFSKSVIAVCLFVSNFLFWSESGYFGSAGDEKPLLHTWSLAVEEQYYMFFPLFLLLMWRFGPRKMVYAIIAVAACSLALAQWSSGIYPDAAFYLPHTRVWELFAGSLCAFYFQAKERAGNNWLAAIGLGLIAFAVFAYDSRVPFPSLYALVPVAGTVLVILFASSETLVARFLGLNPMVGIGLISYSAYLWHQPVLAFARIRVLHEPSPWVMGGAALLTLPLAWMSWRYIEQPFRQKSFTPARSREQIFALSASASALFILLGAWGSFTDQFYQWRTSPAQKQLVETARPSPKRDNCHTFAPNYMPPQYACAYFTDNVEWATFGDSHTVELSYALAGELKKMEIGLKHLSFSGCRPSFGQTNESSACARWTRDAIGYLTRTHSIRTVVVSYRINAYLAGDHAKIYPNIPQDWSEEAKPRVWSSYIGTLKALRDAGKQVVLVLQVPELPRPMEQLIYNEEMDEKGRLVGVPCIWWAARNRYVEAHLTDVPKGVIVIDPAQLMCDERTCYAARKGQSLYFDDNHMSVVGAQLVARKIMREAGPTAIATSEIATIPSIDLLALNGIWPILTGFVAIPQQR